jgi:hypothetical protein
LEDLSVQVLRLCQKSGLVQMGHVALDGTKVEAINQRPRPGQREPRPCNRPKGARHWAPFLLKMSSTLRRDRTCGLVMAELLDVVDRSSPDGVN